MRLVIGRIGRPHGVRGDVTVDVRTDSPDERFAPGTAVATDPASAGPLLVEEARWHSGILLLRFAGVDDRTAAEQLRGTVLVIDSEQHSPPEDPDTYHDHQLEGLTVVTVDGSEVGVLKEIQHAAQDLLVVERQGLPDALVPFVRPLVPEVDLSSGRIVIDPPAGLLDS
jgi:16S rRNA processing protein RimM